MRERGLSIDLHPKVESACREVLRRVLGKERYERYKLGGWIEAPMLRYMSSAEMASCPPWEKGQGGPAMETEQLVRLSPISRTC